jgi:hypothetical protein
MEESNWEATTNRFVAFFDILGFKDYVQGNSHQTVLKHLKQLKQGTRYIFDGRTKEKMVMKTNLKSFLFSDTILIFSASDTMRDLLSLLYLSRIFLGTSIIDKTPIKGAISHGLVTADFTDNIFVGQAIIDAFLLQEKLQLCGAAIDKNTEGKLKEYREVNGFQERITHEIINYETPTKEGILLCYNIKWPQVIIPPNETNPEYLLHTFDRFRFEKFYSNLTGKSKKYYENTLNFMDNLIQLAKTEHPDAKEWRVPYMFRPNG